MGRLTISAVIDSLGKERVRTFDVPDSGIFRVAKAFERGEIRNPDGSVTPIVRDYGQAFDAWVDRIMHISVQEIRAFEESQALQSVTPLPITDVTPLPEPTPDPDPAPQFQPLPSDAFP